jgi:hypothetical protein
MYSTSVTMTPVCRSQPDFARHSKYATAGCKSSNS